MTQADPTEIVRFRESLEHVGYGVVEDIHDEKHFGNRVITLLGRNVDVRIVRDRSDWFVSMRRHGEEDWHGLDAWFAYLDGIEPSDFRSATIAPAIEQFEARLGELEEVASVPDLSRWLAEWELRRTKAVIDRSRSE